MFHHDIAYSTAMTKHKLDLKFKKHSKTDPHVHALGGILQVFGIGLIVL